MVKVRGAMGADKWLRASWGMTWVLRGKMGRLKSLAFLPPHLQTHPPKPHLRFFVSLTLWKGSDKGAGSRLIPACES